MRRAQLTVRVDRSQLDAAVGARLDLDVRAQVDGGVQRRRAVVEQMQGPDVDGAAGQVDAGRRGGLDSHERIIGGPRGPEPRAPSPEPRVPSPEPRVLPASPPGARAWDR